MINVLFMNEAGMSRTKQLSSVPSKGDKVAVFYKPFPTVTNVVRCIDKSLTPEIPLDIDVVVTVD